MPENGSSGACFLRKRGAAGTAKDLISEENGRVQREQTGEHTLFFTQKVRKNLRKSFLWYLNYAILCSPGKPRNKTETQEGNTMKDFELRYVGSHVEVYTGSGVFLFSADTVREAMEELAG